MTKGELKYDKQSVRFYADVEKDVKTLWSKDGYGTGIIHVPGTWCGKKVMCLLLEEESSTAPKRETVSKTNTE